MARTGLYGFKAALLAGAAVFAPVSATAQTQPTVAAAPAEQSEQSLVRLMLQQFDGSREFSHSQTAGYARARRGDEAWMLIDFGNGGIVSTRVGRTEVGSFNNTSGAEVGLGYDHGTRTLTGDPAVADVHNTYIRPLLGRAPAPGTDATWTANVTLAQLGFTGRASGNVAIELSRRYISHDGHDYVLIHYRVPSFTYTGTLGTVVEWGEGVVLTDPSFGRPYWNAALFRAVASAPGSSGRPYRYSRTTAAIDEQGEPIIDPRRIPEVATHFGHLYGHANAEVMGYVDQGDAAADQTPLAIASRIDLAALSIGEDSAGDAPVLAAAYTQSRRGAEESRPTPPMPPAASAAVAAPTPAATQSSAEAPVSAPAAAPETPVTKRGGSKQVTPPPSGMQQEADDLNRVRAGTGTATQWATIAAGSAEEGLIFARLETNLAQWQARGEQLQRQFQSVREEMLRSEREIVAKSELRPRAGSETARLTADIEARAAREEQLRGELEAAMRAGENGAPQYRALQLAQQEWNTAIRALETHVPNPGDYVPTLTRNADESIRFYENAAVRMRRLEQEIAEHGQTGLQIALELHEVPPSRLRVFFTGLNTTLGGLGMAMDAWSISTSTANFITEMRQDAATGDINLSRQYGTDGVYTPGGTIYGFGNRRAYFDLAADLMGLAGAAISGDYAGFITSALAITTSSTTDVILAARGMHATNQLVLAAIQQERDMQRRRFEQLDGIFRSMERDLEQARQDLPNAVREGREEMDRAQATSRQRLAEIAARREARQREEAAAERAAEAERQRLIAAHRAENERIYQQNLRRPPTAAEMAQFNRDIAEAMRPDYPTAPPPTPAQLAVRLRRIEERRQREAQAAADAAAVQQAEVDARIRARADADALSRQSAADAQARRAAQQEADRQLRERRRTDVSPVTFTPPTWTPPVWRPPVWVPPTFRAPDPSQIPWTRLGNNSWDNRANNLAYQYNNLSGRVATDLSRWNEWLATQNVRELTRLALLAGYPNLAAALADARNLIRQSQDEGYRRWAMQQPSCGGTVGCGPSFLERWWMKQATVSLGDILAASRDIFSTGGFSDIGISGLNLAYLLRDNALQDGDIVRVRISQFGRTLYQGEVNLTNLGERFNQVLRQGVASLEIYAVNEGFSPPNTAQITLDNVTRGNATQSYSLRTGETATLRIETNARGQ